MNELNTQHETALYQFGDTALSVVVDDNTVWLSQKQLSDLLGISVPTVNHHLASLKDEGEATIRQYLIVATDGKQRDVEHYSLDTVIEVGFAARKSKAAKAFRAWAKSVLTLHVVRAARLQEAVDYSKVKDFIAQSSDYNPNDSACRDYFASVQNKILFAVTGMTAAELIIDRANANAPQMGLRVWQGGNITKASAQVAKNYLTEDELKQITALVVVIAGGAYFLMQKQSSTMRQWVTYVDQQIVLFRCNLLTDKGRYSHEHAMKAVTREYAAFKERTANEMLLSGE